MNLSEILVSEFSIIILSSILVIKYFFLINQHKYSYNKCLFKTLAQKILIERELYNQIRLLRGSFI